MNSKNQLQEIYQKRKLPLPKYRTVRHGGSDHKPLWISTVVLFDGTKHTGDVFFGKSGAELSAALKAINAVRQFDVPSGNEIPAIANVPVISIVKQNTGKSKALLGNSVNSLSSDNRVVNPIIPPKINHVVNPIMVPSVNPITVPNNNPIIVPNVNPITVPNNNPITVPNNNPITVLNNNQIRVSNNNLIVPDKPCGKTAILVDMENMPKFIDDISTITFDHKYSSVTIYAFVGEHHCLVDKGLPAGVIKIISPSTRPDGTDSCMQVYTGMLLAIGGYDSYLIATRDHFGSALVEMIMAPNLGWDSKYAKVITKSTHI